MTRHSSPGSLRSRDFVVRLLALRLRNDFQTEITADAVLQDGRQNRLRQIAEIDVEQRLRRLRVRRFKPARTLDFVAAENFRIGDDNDFRGLKKKSARQARRCATCNVRGVAETVFPPDFLEALAFAVVVAKHMDGIILARPAMQLREEFSALRFGDLRFGRAIADGPEHFEALETDFFLWNQNCIRPKFGQRSAFG